MNRETRRTVSRSMKRVTFRRRRSSDCAGLRGGFTLLELVLALVLAVVLLALIGSAIRLYLSGSQSGRTNVEEAALARNLLQMIAADLRATVRFEPVDTSTIEGLAGAGALAGASGGAGGPGEPGQASGSGSSSESSSSSEDESGLLSEDDQPPNPGLYGDAFALQVDVSRLPRIDQYRAGDEGELWEIGDRPSDIKTITYYLRGGEASGAVEMALTGGGTNEYGLVRRSVDRAVGQWAIENGSGDTLVSREEVLAAEVSDLTFRYFDGTEWVDLWDSDERGELPVAVEIVLALSMRPEASPLAANTATPTNRDSFTEPHLYRLLVRLPLAKPSSLEDTTTESGTER